MILLETIRNAYRQLGRPTDHETLLRTKEELVERAIDRSSEIETLLIKAWHKQQPEAQGCLGGEPLERIINQAYRHAEKQIIEEELSEPIRVLVQAQLDTGINLDYD